MHIGDIDSNPVQYPESDSAVPFQSFAEVALVKPEMIRDTNVSVAAN